MWSDAVIIAAIGAAATCLLGIVQLLLARANVRKTEAVAKKTEENTEITVATKEKTDEIAKTSVEIRGLADGHLSKVTEQLEAANVKLEIMDNQNAALQKLLVDLAKLVKANGGEQHK